MTTLVSSVPYEREMVINYLEPSYVYGNAIGGCLKTGLSTVMNLYLVLLNNLKKFRFHEFFIFKF